MRIVQVNRAEIDMEKVKRELRAAPEPTEEQIEGWAVEDGDAWTDEDFDRALSVYPPPSAEELRATRTRLGLTEAQFAARFGFSAAEIRAYEQGRSRPSGHAASLLRIAVSDPEAAARALDSDRRG